MGAFLHVLAVGVTRNSVWHYCEKPNKYWDYPEICIGFSRVTLFFLDDKEMWESLGKI